MSLLRRIFGLEPKASAGEEYVYPPSAGQYDGSNFFAGAWGKVDEIATLDYWSLRARSAALFHINSYARGIVRRMVTDVINTGLSVESTPDESALGRPEDSLAEWTEIVEKRYLLYCESPEIIDYKGRREDGELQRQIYTEALVGGDCLVINRQDPETSLPQVQVVPGDRVRTPPLFEVDNSVIDGVKLDSRGRHMGYWVCTSIPDAAQMYLQEDEYIYVPARGARTGRKTAWMVFGPDKREDGIRGEPLLGIAIQPLKEISDYRGSAQLKAKINAMIVGFIKRTKDIPASLPMSGGAVKRSTVTGDPTGSINSVSLAEVMPGLYMERLAAGEEPVPYSQHGTDVNFGAFESAVMVGLSWALQIPPEVLMMSFNKNYSASQAANNKWKTYIGKEQPRFAMEHCKNLFEEWFVSEALLGKFEAPGFLEAYADPRQYDVKRAWLQTEWHGQIEPSVDVVKQTSGYKAMVTEGWITNTRAAREINGSKFSANIRRLQRENEMKVAAMRPLLELSNEFGDEVVATALGQYDYAYSDDREVDA